MLAPELGPFMQPAFGYEETYSMCDSQDNYKKEPFDEGSIKPDFTYVELDFSTSEDTSSSTIPPKKDYLISSYFDQLGRHRELSLEQMKVIVNDSLVKKETCLKLQVFIERGRLS